jgi:hypothetical protein
MLRTGKPLIAVAIGVAALVAAPTAGAQTVSATVDPVGFVNTKTGVATVSGTVTCPDGESTNGGAGADISVSQLFAHRVLISGFGNFPVIACTGAPVQWTASVSGGNGRFASGRAHVEGLACTLNECGSFSADIRLKASNA